MKDTFFETTFDKLNASATPLTQGEYDHCIFHLCDFSNADLSGLRFSDCSFTGCNMTLVKLIKTSFQDVKFSDCKILGVRFDQCHEFALSFSFDNCILNHSSFFKLKQKKIRFKNSQLHEVDFTQCDASHAVFDNCDLLRAHFENTILEKADFRTAYNYSIDPEINRIKKAKFSLSEVAGLLNKYDIEIDSAN